MQTKYSKTIYLELVWDGKTQVIFPLLSKPTTATTLQKKVIVKHKPVEMNFWTIWLFLKVYFPGFSIAADVCPAA